MPASESGLLRVDRRALLAFYDDPAPAEKGMAATAINAVAGEEFGLALLIRYLTESGTAPRRIPGPCTTGKMRGHRLDAWVATKDCLYQVEVKNWSAHSFGGSTLAVVVDDDVARDHRTRLWGEYWDGSTFRDKEAAKVLEPMKPPVEGVPIRPLIAFWVPLHPAGSDVPFFTYPLQDKPFDHVAVFSMSNYLRGISDEFIDLLLPETATRLSVLERLFPYGVAGRV